ncbi:DUF4391 family protein [Pseudoduganella danionis]|uniref:DUF4391 family protein n=1 Tax=Pseudoduganella danionis TaxID=1890295 RepID=A0ABW9STP7_9BURK|nr:DUF4391 family protein [Pseudoduganella danionis]
MGGPRCQARGTTQADWRQGHSAYQYGQQESHHLHRLRRHSDVAALKPTNIGVPSFRDSEREYLEVAVLTVQFRPNAKVPRLLELIHRAIPYPLLLVASFHDEGKASLSVSVAHKRFNQGEAGKFVLDEILTTSAIELDALPSASAQCFMAAMSLSNQPNKDLYALYQGWADCIIGLAIAGIVGRFVLPASPEQTKEMRTFMQNRALLLSELSNLRSQAIKEKQMNRLVVLNLSIKRLESQLVANQSVLFAP